MNINDMNYDNGELKDIIASLSAGNRVAVNVSDFEYDLTKITSLKNVIPD